MSDRKVQIDHDFVERLVMDMANHGAYGETGVWRTAYSPEWVAAARTYETWCREAGLEPRRDAVGNVYGVLRGSDPSAPSIVSGSHIDSQTPGGRYDGALGALAALIALRALREQFGQPRVSLEAIAFCEEESSRFPANFWGSRAITGRIAPEHLDSVTALSGETIGEAMREVGLDPARVAEARRDDIGVFIELHIEQGPILEQQGVPVGVVTSVTGIRHWQVELTGEENHAGAFPMDMRRDAMQGFAEIAVGVVDTAHRWGRPAVTTVGRVEEVEPNLAAAVAKRVRFTVDARHPDPERYHMLLDSHERLMREVAARRNLDFSLETRIDHEPCPSDPNIVAALERSAQLHGTPYIKMASGAGHDTQQMAAIAPVAMIFVRSRGGRSHTPEEYSSIEDAVKGIEILANAMLESAY